MNNLNSTSNVKETVYTYDANGSQITKATDEKTKTNTYNAVNQLVGFTDGETIASYTYNADGLRASKTVDGETVKHVWDGAKQVIADVKNGEFYEADCYIRGTGLVAKYNYKNGAKSEYTSGSLSGAFVFDSQGNLVLQGSFALGNTTAPTTWSVGLNSSITNAPNYTKLEGNGWTCGGSALVPVPSCPVVGVGAGADVVMIPEGEDEWKYTGGMGSVLVGSPGIEVHGEYGRTITANSLSTNIFNDYNKVYERVMSWTNNYN